MHRYHGDPNKGKLHRIVEVAYVEHMQKWMKDEKTEIASINIFYETFNYEWPMKHPGGECRNVSKNLTQFYFEEMLHVHE